MPPNGPLPLRSCLPLRSLSASLALWPPPGASSPSAPPPPRRLRPAAGPSLRPTPPLLALAPRRPCASEEPERDARDPQGQVQQVVAEDGVAVGDEPEQAGHHEAQSTPTKNPTAATMNITVAATVSPSAKATTARVNAAMAPSCRERASLTPTPRTSSSTKASQRPPERLRRSAGGLPPPAPPRPSAGLLLLLGALRGPLPLARARAARGRRWTG